MDVQHARLRGPCCIKFVEAIKRGDIYDKQTMHDLTTNLTYSPSLPPSLPPSFPPSSPCETPT